MRRCRKIRPLLVSEFSRVKDHHRPHYCQQQLASINLSIVSNGNSLNYSYQRKCNHPLSKAINGSRFSKERLYYIFALIEISPSPISAFVIICLMGALTQTECACSVTPNLYVNTGGFRRFHRPLGGLMFAVLDHLDVGMWRPRL